MRDDRHREGEDAYHNGRSLRDNPYCRETRASHLWAIGWRSAERDVDVDDEGLAEPST